VIVFQWILLPVLLALFLASVLRMVRATRRRTAATVSALVWLLAALAVLFPNLTIRVARGLGIGRGADLVLYVFVIAYLFSMFYFYNKTQRLESALTEVVRQLARRDALSEGRQTAINTTENFPQPQ
jgi:hypothetical protein